MGTFLFAFNCNKGMHDFHAKAIQNRLDPDFRLLNNPSVDHFSVSSSIKEEENSRTIYNPVIQQVVDSTPSKMPAAIVAVTDDLQEHVKTSSISIQTDDLQEHVKTSSISIQTDDLQEHVKTSSISIQTDDLQEHVKTSSISIQTDDLKEHTEASSVANQTDGLLEEADCDGHEDESFDCTWDNSFDISSNTYPDQDEYEDKDKDEDSFVDELPFDGPLNLFSELPDCVDNNQLQNDDNHSIIQEDNQNNGYCFSQETENALERPSNYFLSLHTPLDDDRDEGLSGSMHKDQNQNRAVA
ncbi:hypothetical protein [Candidatus Cardinium hertigii]|uniref:hypothetical protein n=1 Tax=Candidatus Cardinium hertigii TaxID=247481 RepID=UPI003D7E9EDC